MKQKIIIRMVESDLVNIVKQCLFESVKHTSLLTENAQDKRVQKYLKSEGYSDYNERMKLIHDLKHNIPCIEMDKGKFLLGCLRMSFDGLLRDEQSYRYVDNALRHISTDGHTDEFDENLNGMTPDELHEMFQETIRQSIAKDRERSANRIFEGGSNYRIIPINSFEEASKYGMYTEWCVTQKQKHFDKYTKYGNRFYFCLRNGFESVERNDEDAPLNEWGLSMISVNIDMGGNVCYITTRYNHGHNGENNSQLRTPEQLENVLNVPFYQTFKPYTRQELLDMGVVPFDMVQELLDSGKAPKEIFQETDNYFSDGYVRVKLNDKYNFINGEFKLLSPKWFDSAWRIKNGFAWVELNYKWNFINTEGKFLSPKWFDSARRTRNGFVQVELDGKHNFIDTEGRLVSPNQWFDKIRNFHDGYAAVELDGKYNFINGEGVLLSSKWFDDANDFKDGFAMVTLNGKSNFIDTKVNILYQN